MITQVHEIDCEKCEPGHLMLLGGKEGARRIFQGQESIWRETWSQKRACPRTLLSLWRRERREVTVPPPDAGLGERLQISDIHRDRNHPDEYDLRVEVDEFSCGCSAFKGHQSGDFQKAQVMLEIPRRVLGEQSGSEGFLEYPQKMNCFFKCVCFPLKALF